MSGIVGILHLDESPVDRNTLQALTDFLTFRGPDAQQIWVDGPVGFGHTLLKTAAEPETAPQPFSLDGAVWIVADARLRARGLDRQTRRSVPARSRDRGPSGLRRHGRCRAPSARLSSLGRELCRPPA